ncbi:MAG: hypothetical protein L6Q29_03565 [Candidatus Pacebacteria bacterium]|nr:hypothetical protein [Candidatus Paceibacterota bacterium]NUQ57485.1 hypothetical protein [Candidatus Paceibacter sp.]
MTPKQIKNNWNEFLRQYYWQPCGGCEDGHSSFWRSVIESEEWRKWKESQMTKPKWDFAECEGLGIMSKKHWKEFVKFIKNDQKTI